MFAVLLAPFLKYLADDAIGAIFNLITGEMQKRSLIAQGQAQQHSADLEAAVKDDTDAAQIRSTVQGKSDGALDADLERLRQQPAASNK